MQTKIAQVTQVVYYLVALNERLVAQVFVFPIKPDT